jgi:prevent-host-death family protein
VEVPVKEAKNRLSELLHLAEAGETVVLTRHGKPVADIVPHQEKKVGINWQALAEYKKAHGIDKVFTFIAPDFDEPLPEDFLITPASDR